ncbi:MAG: 1,3-beta-glucanosyltransferase gas1 [Piccolia ochrophora]|nr:MAG: 1,3-beta-glucanosyltransferase gas1 [Piccolia ochrophora]
MRVFELASTAVAAALFSTAALADVDPIIIKGTKFFYKSNGTEFFMKGVAYQENFSGNGTQGNAQYTDPLADVEKCRRDVPLLQELQTNTIRVYAVDPSRDHDECMQMLQDAGIYVISDLSQPDKSINRDTPSWNVDLYARYAAVIDMYSKYNNVIGFFAGNEVSNAENNTAASPFVKAAVRDMKAYIKRRNYRPMGVGYATSDDENIRDGIASYFACGDEEERVDFYGYNIYSWCGDSDYQESGFKDRTEDFSDYPVPAFFAEYGCNVPSPREFTEVETLYGDEMTPVWSGGIVYMYFQEDNNYGLVSVDGNEASKLPDFTALSSQLAQITPSAVEADSYEPTNTEAPACPTGGGWNASSDLPPSPNQELCDCVVRSLGCTAKTELSDDDVEELFSTVCGLDKSACEGIAADGSSGTYGALSMCAPLDKLSWAFNSYYTRQRRSSKACDFDGNAQIQDRQDPDEKCRGFLEQVGGAGTGSVTSVPTATGNAEGVVGVGQSQSSSSTSTAGAAGALTAPRLEMGMLQLGAYIFGAILTGAGMILL